MLNSRVKVVLIYLSTLSIIWLLLSSEWGAKQAANAYSSWSGLKPRLNNCSFGHSAINASLRPIDVVMAVDMTPQNSRLAEFRTSFTSLFYMASCHINFHVVAKDTDTQVLLKSLPEIRHVFNQAHSLKFYGPPDFQGVKHSFRSQFALAKLFIEKILPESVTRALIVDFDTLFVADICQNFHEQVDLFKFTEIFGLAPEYGDWYTKVHPEMAFEIALQDRRFPLYNGLNSGIILADVEKMRKFNWNAKWIGFWKDLEQQYPGKYHLPLGDQDIFNRYGRIHPETIHVVPSEWNWQPSEKTEPLSYETIIIHGKSGRFDSSDSSEAFMQTIWFRFCPESVRSFKGIKKSAAYKCRARRFFFENGVKSVRGATTGSIKNE